MSGGRGDAITFPELDGEYEVLRVVSRGTFSTVYLARLRAHPDRHVALKRVMRTSAPERTANEVECLIMAGGRCNVCPILHANRCVLVETMPTGLVMRPSQVRGPGHARSAVLPA